MHLAKSGRFIVRLATGAKVLPGEILLDGRGRKVAKVIELIGPVSAPYASAAPLKEGTERAVGSKVFSAGPAGKSGPSRKGRRQHKPARRGRRG